MELSEIQRKQKEFVLDRKWERFNPSQVFVHLIEEIGEIGSFLLYDEKYKVKGIGHKGQKEEIEREFAQVFNLFMQLAMHYDINLENAWLKEYKRNLKRFDAQKWKELADHENSSD